MAPPNVHAGRATRRRRAAGRVLGRLALGALAAAAALLPASVLAGASKPSPTADRLSGVYDAIFWVAIGVLAVVEALILATSLRTNGSTGDDAASDFGGLARRRSEVAWTLAPALLLVLIAVLSYRAFH